jgi:hypothetical protein
MNRDGILFGLTAFTLLLSAIIPMFGYTPPGVTNPWADLTNGLGYQAPSTGSVTINQMGQPQNVQHSSAVQGCVLGGLAGAAAGAIVGGALGLGVGAIPGAVVGFFGFGALGCVAGGAVGNSFPTGTTQLFSSIVSATGPIGSFLQGVTTALQYVYPFVQFVIDWVPYEFALASYEPAYAGIMGIVISLAILMWVLRLADMWRGTGTMG